MTNLKTWTAGKRATATALAVVVLLLQHPQPQHAQIVPSPGSGSTPAAPAEFRSIPSTFFPTPQIEHRIGGLGNRSLLNGATIQRTALVFMAQKAGTLDSAEFRMWAANTPGSIVRMSFQSLTAAGVPDGVDAHYVDLPATIPTLWNSHGSMTSDGTSNGSKRTVVRGEWLALVWAFTGTTTGNPLYTMVDDYGDLFRSPAFYWTTYNGSAWAKNVNIGDWPCVAIRYSDGTYTGVAPQGFPHVARTLRAYHSGSTPDEYALRFTAPADLRVSGLWATINLTTNTAFDLVLYGSDDTVLGSVSGSQAFAGATAVEQPTYFPLGASVELVAGDVYRVAVKPTDTVNVSVLDDSVSVEAIREATGFAGLDAARSVRTNGGVWTDDETLLPRMGVIIDGVR